MKNTVINTIEKNKIIAILRGISADKLIPVAEALYNGGIRVMEITYDLSGNVSDKATAKNIEELSKYFEGRMLIGAGTVINKTQVSLTRSAGGLFIISPDTDKEVITESLECGLVSIPGAFTPTEVAQAHKFGADFVKLFPITNMGPEYVKAIKAPLSHIKLLAVGGIDENNLKSYLNAGVCGFGVGSNITDRKMIESSDFKGITILAEKYTEAIKNA